MDRGARPHLPPFPQPYRTYRTNVRCASALHRPSLRTWTAAGNSVQGFGTVDARVCPRRFNRDVMGPYRSLAGFAVVCGLLALAPRAQAAPDNTLGMATMAAAVDPAGNLTRGSGAVSVTTPNTGVFHIFFDRAVSNCFTYATIAANNVLYSGQISTAPINNPSNQVTVQTVSSSGTAVSLPFHLMVFCNQ